MHSEIARKTYSYAYIKSSVFWDLSEIHNIFYYLIRSGWNFFIWKRKRERKQPKSVALWWMRVGEGGKNRMQWLNYLNHQVPDTVHTIIEVFRTEGQDQGKTFKGASTMFLCKWYIPSLMHKSGFCNWVTKFHP